MFRLFVLYLCILYVCQLTQSLRLEIDSDDSINCIAKYD